MYRIGQKTYAVYKVGRYAPKETEITLFSTVEWNQPLPETLFAFEPPTAAHEAPPPTAAEIRQTSIVGTAAPGFHPLGR